MSSSFTDSQRLWIDALRSGKYRKKLGCLAGDYYKGGDLHKCFCAEGVACELYCDRFDDLELNGCSYLFRASDGHWDSCTYRMPGLVASWLDYDLTSAMPGYSDAMDFVDLAEFMEEDPGKFFLNFREEVK